jgi:predicted ATPase with chaperone activity
MVVRVATVAFEGIEAKPVDVQVQIANGNVVFTLVGLADRAVGESRERVRAALVASGLALPAKRITVNLAPADMPKEGSHYDLPIALGVMAAIGAIPSDALDGFTVLGELALDGTLTPVAGVLPAAVAANMRGHGLICPVLWRKRHTAGAGLLSRAVRQPLETGEVSIVRANHRAVYPARFQLIAAMNPCRCGHALDPGFACKRQPNERCAAQYQARLSGPLLDRFDLQIEVPAITAADLVLPPPAEGSKEVAARVAAAREMQRIRYESLGRSNVTTNAAAPANLIESVVSLDASGTALIREASERFALSARGFHRVLKLARTIADLESADVVSRRHLAEALSYRSGLTGMRRAA